MTEGGRDPRTPDRAGAAAALKVQFVLFFVIAAAGSLWLSFSRWTWAPVAWASFWMFAYLGFARRRSPEHVRGEDFADSFYYLGFLLTLVALVGVLVQLGDGGEDLLGTVLSQFGLALVTTVIGLTGRVALIMFRSDVENVEDAARHRVEQAYDSLTQSLDRMAAEADAFTQGFGGNLRAALDPIDASAHRFVVALDEATRRIPAVRVRLDEVTASIEDTTRKLGASADGLAGGLEAARERMDESLDAIDRRLAETFDEMRSAAASIRRVGADFGGQASESIADFERAATAIRRDLEAVASALEDLPTTVETATSQSSATIRSLERYVGQLEESLTGLRTDVQAVGVALQIGGSDMRDALNAWKESADELERVHARLVQESEGASEAIVQVRRELAQGVRFLIGVLRRDDDREPAEL